MLATNPCDPNVMDKHIVDRQRKLIMDRSAINVTVNKYLDQLPIAKEKGEAEVNLVFEKLEKLTGLILSDSERETVLSEGLGALKETFAELDVKGTTVFFWNKEKDLPMIGDHMIYGFLKASAEAISRTKAKKNGVILHSASYTQSAINQYVRCDEQFLTFDTTIKEGYVQRSLRAKTAQGPRITLAKSEAIPAGAKLQFVLKVMTGCPIEQSHLEELFAYGELSGLGQWRNAGYGQFKAEISKA